MSLVEAHDLKKSYRSGEVSVEANKGQKLELRGQKYF